MKSFALIVAVAAIAFGDGFLLGAKNPGVLPDGVWLLPAGRSLDDLHRSPEPEFSPFAIGF